MDVKAGIYIQLKGANFKKYIELKILLLYNNIENWYICMANEINLKHSLFIPGNNGFNKVVAPSDAQKKLAKTVSHAAEKIIKTSNSFKTSFINALKWVWSRAKEIPFLIRNPRVIVNKFYRWRVRREMNKSQTSKTITIHLSKLLPAHRIDGEGNTVAEQKNKERIKILKNHKNEFDKKLENQEPISQEFIESLMESTSPIQLAYDDLNKQCIAFDGNSRLIAIQRFFSETYPNKDPEVQVKVYQVANSLLKHVMPKQNFSVSQK